MVFKRAPKPFSIFIATVASLNFFIAWYFTTVGLLEIPPISHQLQPASDSTMPIYKALQEHKSSPDQSIYQKILIKNQDGAITGVWYKYQYPPSALLYFAPFANWSRDHFFDFFDRKVSAVFFWAGLLTLWLLIERICNKADDSVWDRLLRLLSCVMLAGTFYPYVKAYGLGQIQVWINTLILFALFFIVRKEYSTAGILFGLAALIKPQYGLMLIWGLLEKRKALAIALLTVFMIGFLSSILVFGASSYGDYMKLTREISRRGEYYYKNQSINGLINRLVVQRNNLAFDMYHYAPYRPLVHVTTLLGTLVLLGTAVYWRWKRRAETNTGIWGWLIALSAITLSSPTAWEHTYGFTVASFVIAIYWLYERKALNRNQTLMGMTLVALFFSSHSSEMFDLFFAQAPLNLLQSLLFFAQLLLLWILFRIASENVKMAKTTQAI